MKDSITNPCGEKGHSLLIKKLVKGAVCLLVLFLNLTGKITKTMARYDYDICDHI